MKAYRITIYQLPRELEKWNGSRWEAEHGDHHARGMTPGQAVDRLVAYLETIEKAQQ